MKVLGVDPGSHITGYGLLESDKGKIKLLEVGIIKARDRDPLSERILKMYKNLEDIVDIYRPDVLVLEKIYTHGQYVTTASILGHVRGAVCLLCAQKKICLSENSVRKVRKVITGNGAATKEQTKHMVAHLLNIDPAKLTVDASDALALALGHLHLSRE